MDNKTDQGTKTSEKQPLIVVVGTNNSGSSMITKLLLDNGCITGEWKSYKGDPVQERKAPYEKYEDSKFTSCIKKMMGDGLWLMKDGDKEDGKEALIEYWKTFPKDKPLVMKFPSAVYCLNALRAFTDRPFRVVYCIRNINEFMVSFMFKSGLDLGNALNHYSQMQAAIALYKGSVHFCMYERLLEREETDLDALFQYCGLDHTRKDLRAIDKDQVKFKKVINKLYE